MTDTSSSHALRAGSSESGMIGIRRLLMTPSAEMNQFFCITGVVSSITTLETDYKDTTLVDEEASSYQPSKKFRTELVLNNIQKCQVVLRDKKHADTITLYAPNSVAASLSTESVIMVVNCKLCMSQGKKKKLYLILSNDKARKYNIEVLGLQRQENANDGLTRSKYASSRSTDQHKFPSPSGSIYSLFLTSAHNRCLWTIQGHVTFLRKIFVSLRCSKCCRLAHCSNNQIQFTCPQKCPGGTVTPLWETSLAFDDGTAEADVRLEGEAALYVLRAVGDTQSLGLKHVQEKVDRWVQRTGKFMYDSISAKYERDADEFDENVQFGSEMKSNDEIVKLLDTYLINCSYLRNYELICSVDQSISGAAVSSFSSSARSSGTAVKKIHLQDVNTDQPHRIQFSAVVTRTTDKLALVGHGIRELRTESLRLAAWDLLTTLEEDNK